jgi:hypothetical protein
MRVSSFVTNSRSTLKARRELTPHVLKVSPLFISFDADDSAGWQEINKNALRQRITARPLQRPIERKSRFVLTGRRLFI